MFIDAHNHLDFYKDNIDNALNIINKENILTVACSVDRKSYDYAKEISKSNDLIIPCYGIHPFKVNPELSDLKDLDYLRKLIDESPMIGEIGLDSVWVEDKKYFDLQLEVLEFFLAECKKRKKIVNLHTKGGEAKIASLLKEYVLDTPIIHWYSGPIDILEELIKLDCYFTISVDIKYSRLTREIVRRVPLERILTETDGPTALEWVNGEYGYPDYIKIIIREIAKLKFLTEEEIKYIVEENFRRLLDGRNII